MKLGVLHDAVSATEVSSVLTDEIRENFLEISLTSFFTDEDSFDLRWEGMGTIRKSVRAYDARQIQIARTGEYRTTEKALFHTLSCDQKKILLDPVYALLTSLQEKTQADQEIMDRMNIFAAQELLEGDAAAERRKRSDRPSGQTSQADPPQQPSPGKGDDDDDSSHGYSLSPSPEGPQ